MIPLELIKLLSITNGIRLYVYACMQLPLILQACQWKVSSDVAALRVEVDSARVTRARQGFRVSQAEKIAFVGEIEEWDSKLISSFLL